MEVSKFALAIYSTREKKCNIPLEELVGPVEDEGMYSSVATHYVCHNMKNCYHYNCIPLE